MKLNTVSPGAPDHGPTIVKRNDFSAMHAAVLGASVDTGGGSIREEEKIQESYRRGPRRSAWERAQEKHSKESIRNKEFPEDLLIQVH